MMRFQITLGGTLAGLRVTDAGVPTAVFILLKIVLRAAMAILHNDDAASHPNVSWIFTLNLASPCLLPASLW
jgi:hypothetical protein